MAYYLESEKPEWAVGKGGAFYRLVKSPSFWFDTKTKAIIHWSYGDVTLYIESKKAVSYRSVQALAIGRGMHTTSGATREQNWRKERYEIALLGVGLTPANLSNVLLHNVSKPHREDITNGLEGLVGFMTNKLENVPPPVDEV